jgi:hypothetical protein
MRNFKAVGPALFAILMWSTLALAGSGLQDIPRFLLLGITFLTSGLLTGFRRDAWRIPFKVLMTGTAGIFGYHYF